MTALKNFLSAKHKRFVLRHSFRVCWLLHFDSLIAWILGLIIASHNRDTVPSHHAQTIVLAFDRVIFNDDTKALADYSTTHRLPYRFLFYPSYLRSLFTSSGIWPLEMQPQVTFYTRRTEYAAFLTRMERICEQTLYSLMQRFSARRVIVLSAQIDYALDYPWVRAVKRAGSVFVALNKESIIYSEKYADLVVDIYTRDNFFYEGDLALFYNEFARDLYIRARTLRREDTKVVGCPRVDELVSMKKNTQGRDAHVLVAAFQDATHGAPELWFDMLEVMHHDEFVRSRTVIKCRDTREIEGIKNRFPGFEVVSGPIWNFFAKNPAVFVGFNSTSCLDALITKVPLVIPWWHEAKNMSARDAMLGPHTKDFHGVAYDPESLVNMVRLYLNQQNHESSGEYNPRLKSFLEEKYSPLDGMCRERFFDEIGKIIS